MSRVQLSNRAQLCNQAKQQQLYDSTVRTCDDVCGINKEDKQAGKMTFGDNTFTLHKGAFNSKDSEEIGRREAVALQ